jgi:hypothetical protein
MKQLKLIGPLLVALILGSDLLHRQHPAASNALAALAVPVWITFVFVLMRNTKHRFAAALTAIVTAVVIVAAVWVGK